MAGEWIKMRTDLADDPRVQKIADMVGVRDVDLVVGKLHRLWSYADQYTTDGTMRHMTTAILDRRFGLKGLGAALVSVGWMVVLDDEQGIVIPNFDDHNGASAKRRAMESRRKMTARRADSRAQDGGKVSAADADNSGTRRGRFAHLDIEREREREREFDTTNDGSGSESELSHLNQSATAIEMLVIDIAQVTGEKPGGHRRLVRSIPLPIVHRALAETRTAKLSGEIRKSPGALFTGLCKQFCEEQGVAWPLKEHAA